MTAPPNLVRREQLKDKRNRGDPVSRGPSGLPPEMPGSEGSHPPHPQQRVKLQGTSPVYLGICWAPAVGARDEGRRGETRDDTGAERVEWVGVSVVGWHTWSQGAPSGRQGRVATAPLPEGRE